LTYGNLRKNEMEESEVLRLYRSQLVLRGG